MKFLKKNNIAFLTYLTTEVKNYIEGIKDHPPLKFLPMGADFELHKPGNKIRARKKLGLEEDKIYGIYVGSFYKLKSVDLILDAYYKLKYEFNFSVIFVGGENNPDNDLYQKVVDSGCPYFGLQEDFKMTDFYNAANFYIHPAFNPRFGGIDVTWMEALACNIPVISPKLSYLDFDYTELGLSPLNYEDFLKKLEIMIKNYRNYNKCREISQKYLDGNTAIMENLYRIYLGIYNSHLKGD